MANHKSTIALLVPVYNGEKYIDQFHQNLSELKESFDEILFYNDGSTDNSLGAIKKLGYKVINSAKNKGPAFSRNQLINASSAKWVHFHDIDDIMCADYLAAKLHYLESNYNAIICDADWINAESGNTIIKWRYSNSLLQKDGAGYLLRNPIGGINGLYKRDVLLEIGGFDENLKIWEDADMHLRLYLFSPNIFFLEKTLVKSLRGSNSTSSNILEQQKNKLMFLNKYKFIDDSLLKASLIIEADKFYHSVVYKKQWSLYEDCIQLFIDLGIKPPIIKKRYLNFLRSIIGGKTFTRLKYHYLKHIKGLEI